MTILGNDEHVVAAWAEPAAGPGWSNCPVKVLVVNGDGAHRVVYLQPDEQTSDMVVLYRISAAVATSMRSAVERALRPRGARKAVR